MPRVQAGVYAFTLPQAARAQALRGEIPQIPSFLPALTRLGYPKRNTVFCDHRTEEARPKGERRKEKGSQKGASSREEAQDRGERAQNPAECQPTAGVTELCVGFAGLQRAYSAPA